MHPNVSVDGPSKLVGESAHLSPAGKRKVSFPRSLRRQVTSECPKCAEVSMCIRTYHVVTHDTHADMPYSGKL